MGVTNERNTFFFFSILILKYYVSLYLPYFDQKNSSKIRQEVQLKWDRGSISLKNDFLFLF